MNNRSTKKFLNKKYIMILIIILLSIISIYYFSNKNNNNINDIDDNNQSIENNIEGNKLLYEFNNNLIDSNEYIKQNIYYIYDKTLFNNKYGEISEVNINILFDRYYNELNDETKRLYFDFIGLSDLTFKDLSNNEIKPLSSENLNNSVINLDTNYSYNVVTSNLNTVNLSNKVSDDKTKNLDKVYLSPNKKFLLWYTTEGNSAVDKKIVENYSILLENIISKYDEIFNLKYKYESKIISTGSRYKDQINLLKKNNIDEKYMNESFHVYIYDINSDSTYGYYQDIHFNDSKLKEILRNIYYENDDKTIITPYIVLNSKKINENSSESIDVLSHELFHHYQNYVINNSTEYKKISDNLIGEATAQWAAAKITKNESKNTGLNLWVSNYFLHPNDILTTAYDKYGFQVGYALFKFLYSYENNVTDGLKKILNSIHYENGLKYLFDNSTNEEQNKIMQDLSLKNLNNDYPNNNYLPKNNDTVKLKSIITNELDYSKYPNVSTNISPIGIEYYLIDINSSKTFLIELSSDSLISINLIGLKKDKYEIIYSKNNINNKEIIDTNNIEDYDKLYISILNNDFINSSNYNIKISPGVVKNTMTFKTNYKNYKMHSISNISINGLKTTTIIDAIVDELHQKEYLETTTNFFGLNVKTESYVDFASGYTYNKIPFTNQWEKIKEDSTIVNLALIMDKFNNNGNISKINDNLYKVILSPDDIKKLGNADLKNYEINGNIYAMVTINDGYILKIEYDFSNLISEIDEFKMVMEFSDYNVAGDVNIPVDIIN